ncbi:polysaccharide synthase [Polychytrium aggregatum]|uniref:polysaccharide synthase n=1 Tax=Polychytrium aggregatum TaxID=110093 RepID=UPI0022FE4D23|nr:polysaccharide synthase [Polychytrium aggregatum]KAI9206705.1 polysaccharide synthase [Polychytrium aggregatum]
MFYLTNEHLSVFIPLGFVGIYRWFWFCVKLLAYCVYKPIQPRRKPRYIASRDVTILVPTIDSGVEIKTAVRSWLQSKPNKIIFITTPKAKAGLEELANSCNSSRDVIDVITVPRPNKRNQMVAGINRVKTELIVFSDDDAIWPDSMLEWALAPFEDKQVGGVGTSQTVLPVGKRMSVWEILSAFRISMRNIEITASTYIDGGVCCLSGRTAIYRTKILRDPEFQWKFTHEYWLGKYHQHSGDDKFLTRWLHAHYWKTFIQSCPEVELLSTFKNNWTFLKQILRWTRNTWRSDIRSLFVERVVWTRYPFVAFTMLDKFFNPITLLAGPVTVIYLCVRKMSDPSSLPVYVVLASYFVWLFLTRLIKYMPHFVRRPQDILAIPVWLGFNILFALMKVYCLFTLHVTSWGTRSGADNQEKHDLESEMDIYKARWMECPELDEGCDLESQDTGETDPGSSASAGLTDQQNSDSVADLVDGISVLHDSAIGSDSFLSLRHKH